MLPACTSRSLPRPASDAYTASTRFVYQHTASTGDWKDWANCFTPDATYIECADGNFWGRPSILKWITDLMSPWRAREMTAFPVAWYTIDEDKGWIIAEVRNRMNDLGGIGAIK